MHDAGVTGTVCSNHWDDNDASVVCRSLGLSNYGKATFIPRDLTRSHTIFGMYCMGNESFVNDCAMDTFDFTYGQCANLEDAGVDCYSSKYD